MWPFKRKQHPSDAPSRATLLLGHGELAAIASLDALEAVTEQFEAVTEFGLLQQWSALFSIAVATIAMTEVADTVHPSQQEDVFATIKSSLDAKSQKAYADAVLPLLEDLRSARGDGYDLVVGSFVLQALAQLAPDEPAICELASHRKYHSLVGQFIISAGHNFFANDRNG